MPKETPKEFDLAGFISRATRPMSACTIYGDGKSLGEMRRLEKLIREEKFSPGTAFQKPMGGKALRTQYAEAWARVQESGMDVWVKGHTFEETEEMVGHLDRSGDSKEAQQMRNTANMILIADAIVTDTDQKFTLDDMQALRNIIGERQWKEIEFTYTEACTKAVTPDADFLPHAYTQGDGETSSQH